MQDRLTERFKSKDETGVRPPTKRPAVNRFNTETEIEMTGTWNRYATVRAELLALLATERAKGRTNYIASIRQEMVAARRTHWAKGRQRRYNLGFAA